MTDLPYRPEHVHDAMADTDELTNEELGAYIRLQRALWRAGGYLAADRLARFSRAGRRWGKLAPAILTKLTIIDGRASCAILLELLLRTRERRASAVDKARKGGLAKASKGAFATHQNGRLNSANPLESHSAALLQAAPKRANQNQKIDSKSDRQSEASAELLYTSGVAMLMERVKVTNLAARSQISKWLVDVETTDELATLLTAAAEENLTEHRFIAIIDQRVKAIKRLRERGPPLPLGFQPNLVRK